MAENDPLVRDDYVSRLVSVVIPTYNHAHFLQQALQSVVDQSYSNWEALVVDNHSDDHTDDVVASFADPRIRLLKIHNNGVIAASRNLGIRNSRGEWVAFLDSDDYWHVKKLEISIRYLKKGADIVYHNMYKVQERGNASWRRRYVWRLKSPVMTDLIIKGNALPNSSVVVRRQLLIEIDGLDESRDLITYEDYDAWIRIAALTERFVLIPRILGYYWIGGGNLSHGQEPLFLKTKFDYLEKLDNQQLVQANAANAYLLLRGAYNKTSGRCMLDSDTVRDAMKTTDLRIKLKVIYLRIMSGMYRVFDMCS